MGSMMVAGMTKRGSEGRAESLEEIQIKEQRR